MRTNQAGINLLKKWEGFSNVAYKDVVGIPTIGYGFIKNVHLGDTITREDAEKRLKLELISREQCISENCHATLNENEFSALVCLVYNIGCGAFKDSTLLKMLNANDNRIKVSDQFLRWNKAGGKEVAGLTNRRLAEKELFLKAV